MTENKKKRTETFASIFGDESDDIVEESKDNTGTIMLNIDDLIPFENHPFKLYEGARLDDMVESIKNFGIIVPIVVRKKDDKYQILSGHNRANSAKIVGISEVPAIIKENLTEEEATLIVTETNLMQRSFADLTHSERATVIATRHSAMKSQGVRTDLLNEIEQLSKAGNLATDETSRPMGEKLNSDKNLAKEYGISPRNISRYLRIDKLNDALKNLVDEGKVAMRAGVDLSYLSNDNQEMIEAIISENTFKVDMKKVASIRIYDKNGQLTWDTAKAIISGEINKKEKKPTGIKIQPKIISKYFRPEEDKKDIESIIEKALELYFNKIKDVEVIIEEEEECEQI